MRIQAVVVRLISNEVLYHRTYREGVIHPMWMGPGLADLPPQPCLLYQEEGDPPVQKCVDPNRDPELHYYILENKFAVVAKMYIEPITAFNDKSLEIQHHLKNLTELLNAFITIEMTLARQRRNTLVVMELAINPDGFIFSDMTTNFLASLAPEEVVNTSPAFSRPLDLMSLVRNKIIKPAQNADFRVSPLGTGSGSGLGGGGLMNNGSDIWWRRYIPLDHYSQNEILIDLVEILTCRINMKGVVQRTWLTGKVEIVARLNGLPECILAFDGVDKVGFCRFHYCVKTEPELMYNEEKTQCSQLRDAALEEEFVWLKDMTEVCGCLDNKWKGRVRFVPEDGSKFKVMDFLAKPGPKYRPPLGFKATWSMDENGLFKAWVIMSILKGQTVGFTNRLPNKTQAWILENVKLRIPMYPPEMPEIPRIESSCTFGKSGMDKQNLIWEIGRVDEETMTQKLEIVAQWHPRDVKPNKRLRGILTFSCNRRNLSGINISHIEIKLSPGDKSSLFKGYKSMVQAGSISYEF